MSRTLLAPLALVLSCGSVVAADDFGRLAPPDAALVVNVSDYTRAKERLLATPLGGLIEEPSIAELLEEARQEQMASFEELATELGIDVEAWPEPAGMVGFALVNRPLDEAEMWEPQFMQLFVGAIDFGDRIGEISRIVDAVVEKGLDQGLIEVETDEVGGVEVLTITTLLEDEIPADDEMDVEEIEEGPTGLAGLLGGLEKVTLAISDSTLYLGGEREMVMDVLDRARGADVPSIADDEQFGAALAQHPDGTTEYLVAFPGRLGVVEGFSTGLGFFLPPGMDLTAMLGDLGITNVKAISVGVDLESADAQAELTLGVLDTERTGLVSLLDVTDEAWDPPSFVTPDAVAATRLLVDFSSIPGVLREFWGTLPPEFQEQGGAGFEQAMAFVEPIAPLLGPEVHLVQTLTRPFGATSAGMAYIIPTADELPINNLLVLGSTSGALTARDFGQTKVFDLQDGSLSLAVAYGHVFIGMPGSVDGALRLAAAGGGDSLGQDEAFRSAMRPHPSTGNVVQFTRTLEILEYTLWSLQNAAAMVRQQLLDSGWTEEEIEEYGMAEDATPEWVKGLTVDVFEGGVGDVSMEITPSEDGFRGRILIHQPR